MTSIGFETLVAQPESELLPRQQLQLGRLVEVVSGRSLPEFFAERIFQPLGMVDTSFVVPVDKRPRVVTAYGRSAGGTLVAVPPYPMAPKFFSAGGNMLFAQQTFIPGDQELRSGFHNTVMQAIVD